MVQGFGARDKQLGIGSDHVLDQPIDFIGGLADLDWLGSLIFMVAGLGAKKP